MRDPEELLPPELLSAARVSGREYGWSFDRVNEVLDAAKALVEELLFGLERDHLEASLCRDLHDVWLYQFSEFESVYDVKVKHI